jgi:HlyD family secretion protein
MTRPTTRTLLGVTAVLAVGIFGCFFLTERPIKVPVVTIEQNVAVRVYGLGTIEARIVSRVGFEVGAALTGLMVDSGDTVAKGQVLARLHPAEQQARVARAKAAVAAAEASIRKADASVERARAVLAQRKAANERQQELVARGTISAQASEEAQRDVDVAAADLVVAQSDVDVVKAQAEDGLAALQYENTLLAHHALKAPFDAIIVERHVEAGTVVRAGDVIFTLMDPQTVWTLAYIDEERAGEIALGQVAEIRLRSKPHNVYSGKVVRIGIESDRANEERRVWIKCDQCPPQIFLGEQAEVLITQTILPEALLVPEIAVSGFNGHQGQVWAVQDGKLAQVTLIFGHRTEDARLEVVSGLPDGVKIVSAPIKGQPQGRFARPFEKTAP